MPYRVDLTTLDNRKTDRTEISYDPTPALGDRILVTVRGYSPTRAEVTAVHQRAPKPSWIAGKEVDLVEAQEV